MLADMLGDSGSEKVLVQPDPIRFSFLLFLPRDPMWVPARLPRMPLIARTVCVCCISRTKHGARASAQAIEEARGSGKGSTNVWIEDLREYGWPDGTKRKTRITPSTSPCVATSPRQPHRIRAFVLLRSILVRACVRSCAYRISHAYRSIASYLYLPLVPSVITTVLYCTTNIIANTSSLDW